VSQYRQAFTERDAAAAKAVWPSVNEGRLRRAFRQLELQEITFAECQTDLDEGGTRAMVTCRGSVRFVPRIGPGIEHVQLRRWEFAVRRFAGRWMLESVQSTESVPAIGRYPDSPLNSPITRPDR
jgi:hypothetical protein